MRLQVHSLGRHGTQAICLPCLDRHRPPAPHHLEQMAGQTSILDVLPPAGAS